MIKQFKVKTVLVRLEGDEKIVNDIMELLESKYEGKGMKIKEQLDILIKDLCNSKALFRPDENAGNLLVDPVIPAAIQYWWDKYNDKT